MVIDWSTDVCHQDAATKTSLRRKGKPIPENDIWIAAFAQAKGLILVARDEPFDHVDGLMVERW